MANLKSSKGERITTEMIDSISAEAEAGYDPTTFRPRPVLPGDKYWLGGAGLP